MAINVEREPIGLIVDDDPLATTNNGHRPAAVTADPAPLGLAALALTTVVFGVLNAGLLDRSATPVLMGLAVAYGGVAQVLAGMWEFRRGNSFGALTFGSFGAFWLSYWVYEQFMVGRVPAAEVGNATALLFIVWAVFTALLWVASLRTTVVTSVMLLLLTLTFLLLGIGDAGGHTELVKIGGWFGIATAVVALYAAFAGVINSTFSRTVLPLVSLHRTAR
jgi:uncharacterized protein